MFVSHVITHLQLKFLKKQTISLLCCVDKLRYSNQPGIVSLKLLPSRDIQGKMRAFPEIVCTFMWRISNRFEDFDFEKVLESSINRGVPIFEAKAKKILKISSIKIQQFLYLAIFNPTKKSATSTSDTCHGRPLALITVSSLMYPLMGPVSRDLLISSILVNL